MRRRHGGSVMGGMRRWAAGIAVAAIASAGLAGCAVGTGGADDADADYDSGADLTGSMSVMGFSGVDEIATSRMDLAEQDLGKVDVSPIGRATGGGRVGQYV